MARAKSQMYQVDFVAALFGGFLLIWLSGATDSDTPVTPAGAPLFVQISGWNIYTDSQKLHTDFIAVIPAAAVGTACLQPDWLPAIYGRAHLPRTCHGAPHLLNPIRADALTQAVKNEAEASSSTTPHQQFTMAEAVAIELSPSIPVPSGEVSWIGRATGNLADDYPGENFPISIHTEQFAVAAVPRNWSRFPTVWIRHPAQKTAHTFDQFEGSAGDAAYYLTGETEERALTAFLTTLVRTELRVVWDLGGRNECKKGFVETQLQSDQLQQVTLDTPC